MLGKRHDVAVTFWTEHKPGPGTSPDYWIASTDFAPRAAEDVTEELVQQAVDIVDGWYNEGRIDWEDVFDRLEKHTLDNGQGIDLGEDLGSPALKTLQRRVRAARKEH
jgi:hypothetical protein